MNSIKTLIAWLDHQLLSILRGISPNHYSNNPWICKNKPTNNFIGNQGIQVPDCIHIWFIEKPTLWKTINVIAKTCLNFRTAIRIKLITLSLTPVFWFLKFHMRRNAKIIKLSAYSCKSTVSLGGHRLYQKQFSRSIKQLPEKN